jgi:hypothetical protein
MNITTLIEDKPEIKEALRAAIEHAMYKWSEMPVDVEDIDETLENFIGANTPIPTVSQLIESRTKRAMLGINNKPVLELKEVEDIFRKLQTGEVINDIEP